MGSRGVLELRSHLGAAGMENERMFHRYPTLMANSGAPMWTVL